MVAASPGARSTMSGATGEVKHQQVPAPLTRPHSLRCLQSGQREGSRFESVILCYRRAAGEPRPSQPSDSLEKRRSVLSPHDSQLEDCPSDDRYVRRIGIV